ncbi:MAG: lysoplasmalogenase, partial [Rudanella sp.]|nr:lysoplasmalogenase [Rudanella sp.]
MTAPSRTFLILFSLITALEIGGEMLPNKLLVYGSKPLIMILLMGWIVAQKPDWQRNYPVRWLLVGTVFALLGDVFLMIREVDMFGPGLGSFLLMQVCYIGAFRQEIRAAKQRLSERRIALTLLPFVAYAGVFLLYLDVPFHRTPGTN